MAPKLAFIPLSEDQRNITLRMLLAHFAAIEHYTNGYGNPVPPVDLANSSETNLGIQWAI